MDKSLRYILCSLLVLVAFILGFYIYATQDQAWYLALIKPNVTPPDAALVAIWAILYVLMAVALLRVCDISPSDARRRWFFAFGIQLAINIQWGLFFFSFHSLVLSLITAIILWFAVVILTLHAAQIDRISFWLLVPYVAWITFALILCVEIWWWN